TGANGTGGTVLLVVPVGAALPLEVVALHPTGEALPLRDRNRIDALSGCEQTGVKLLAHLVTVDVVYAQFNEPLAGLDPCGLEVTSFGFRERPGLAEAPGHLQSRVAL